MQSVSQSSRPTFDEGGDVSVEAEPRIQVGGSDGATVDGGDIGDLRVPDETNFNLQCTGALLTFRSHISKQELKVRLERILCGAGGTKRVKIIELWIAHEHGMSDPTVPYEHTHVAFKVRPRFQSQNPRVFDYLLEDGINAIHPHVRVINFPGGKNTQWDRVRNYISKEDPELAGLRDSLKKSYCEVIAEQPTLKDVLMKEIKCKKNLTLVNGLISLYGVLSKPTCEVVGELRNWQQELFNSISPEIPSDDRTIQWWWESTGNTGKTWFVKWLLSNHPSDYYAITDVGSGKDFATIVESAFNEGWSGHCILVCLSRTEECNFRALYKSLEKVKDGLLTTTKYRGKTTVFNSPHVVVLANWPPMIEFEDGKSTLSSDRWKIVEI